MLDPLLEELLQLQQGVRMTIREGDPPVYREEVVHATITQHIADLIARIKIGGGAGVKSEKNFCLYCHTRLSALSVPDGYRRQGFVYRDPDEDLAHAYQWKYAQSQEERKNLFEQTAVNIIDKRSITPAEAQFAQQLLESLCIDYVSNSIQLPPNFHYLMHLEEWIFKTGSVYNTHVWGMERANGIVSRIKHNGKGKGVLEGTLMRGWWSHVTLQNLIKTMRALPDRTPADESLIDDLLVALKGGNEHALQRGTLMAFIAQCQTAYTRLHGIEESTRLSKQSRMIDLEDNDLYEIVLDFCIQTWPDAGIFGPGIVQRRYLAPTGMVRNHSYVEHDGIRYGAFEHTSGKGYCYGYVENQYPVRIDRILHIVIPGQPVLEAICALVRPFQTPPIEPQFPWDIWASHLGTSSWAYNKLSAPVAISVKRYWVTVALDSTSLENDDDND
ncbi:unnamed protein product [Rhizoctonia solani]|uniref:Uncharacterized protein n=1 Tax=Rhizoctonia solani TaxID=456999 RepID=A0A8H2X151_9AGAM|nr:unnamed protein product [Rhizoctonia solani]